MKSNKRNHYAIPFYLRSEGEKLQDHLIDTEFGPVQADMMMRIDRKHQDGELRYKAAAEELRATAAYIESLAPTKKNLLKELDTPKAEKPKEIRIPIADVIAKTQPAPRKEVFAPEVLEYLATGNPTVLTKTGTFTPQQRTAYKSYCFVKIDGLGMNGHLLNSTKMSNGKPHTIKILGQDVDKTTIKTGPAVVLDDGNIIIGVVMLDPLMADDLSRTFNGFYRG